MTAYVRTTEFENTGNNEGTITWEVAVLSNDGDLLLHTNVYHEWEYFTSLNVDFAEDSLFITLSVVHGDTRTYPLDGSALASPN